MLEGGGQGHREKAEKRRSGGWSPSMEVTLEHESGVQLFPLIWGLRNLAAVTRKKRGSRWAPFEKLPGTLTPTRPLLTWPRSMVSHPVPGLLGAPELLPALCWRQGAGGGVGETSPGLGHAGGSVYFSPMSSALLLPLLCPPEEP